ncbi:MAG: T9SS type A sorting domain-containing protein [Bacteroidota bacterium]|jgi:photosystem II stability/assembly factor-like uncharacterized protein
MKKKHFLQSFVVFTLLSIIISAPGMAQWHVQSTPPDVNMLLSTSFVNEHHGVAAGWAGFFIGKIIYTTNGGELWQSAQLPESTRSCVTVCFPDTNIGYIAGAYNLPTTMKAIALEFPRLGVRTMEERSKRNRGYELGIVRGDSIGYRGYFLKTTDGGSSWRPRGTLPDFVTYLIGGCFIDTSYGFVTYDAQDSGFSGILKTTNGGNTWSESYRVHSFDAFRSIYFLDSLNGIAVGTKSVDSVTSDGIIVRTHDGGATWTDEDSPGLHFPDVYLNSSSEYLVGDSATRSFVLKGDAAGFIWSMPVQMSNTLLHGIRFVKGTDIGIVFGEKIQGQVLSPFIIKTIDGGSTWQAQDVDSLSDVYLAAGQLLNENVGFICGQSSGQALVLHTTNGGVSSAPDRTIKPTYELSQNYPNPFNPSTTIRFTVPELGFVSLKIFNILGVEIATLVSEQLAPGSYSKQWNGSEFASGVYYYRLQAGTYIETRKLLLIK